MIGKFARLAKEGKELTVHGDGDIQKRLYTRNRCS